MCSCVHVLVCCRSVCCVLLGCWADVLPCCVLLCCCAAVLPCCRAVVASLGCHGRCEQPVAMGEEAFQLSLHIQSLLLELVAQNISLGSLLISNPSQHEVHVLGSQQSYLPVALYCTLLISNKGYKYYDCIAYVEVYCIVLVIHK